MTQVVDCRNPTVIQITADGTCIAPSVEPIGSPVLITVSIKDTNGLLFAAGTVRKWGRWGTPDTSWNMNTQGGKVIIEHQRNEVILIEYEAPLGSSILPDGAQKASRLLWPESNIDIDFNVNSGFPAVSDCPRPDGMIEIDCGDASAIFQDVCGKCYANIAPPEGANCPTPLNMRPVACNDERAIFIDVCGQCWANLDETTLPLLPPNGEQVRDEVKIAWAQVGDEIDIITAIQNNSQATREYRVFLYDSAGALIQKEPDLFWKNINAGQVESIGISSKFNPFWDVNRIIPIARIRVQEQHFGLIADKVIDFTTGIVSDGTSQDGQIIDVAPPLSEELPVGGGLPLVGDKNGLFGGFGAFLGGLGTGGLIAIGALAFFLTRKK